VALMAYQESDQLLQDEAVHGVSLQMENRIAQMQEQAEMVRGDVAYLAHTYAIAQLEKDLWVDPQSPPNPDSIRDVQRLFKTLLEQRNFYYQIRLIGVADGGRELVRVARKASGIELFEGAELMRKGNRRYFQAALKLQPGQIYFSDISLNREHGKITQPPTPMLRVSTALHDARGKVYAILLINVDFNRLNAHMGKQFFIANVAGDYLLHADRSKAMAFEYHRQATVTHDFALNRISPRKIFSVHGHEVKEYLFDDAGRVLLLSKVYFDPAQRDRYLQFGAVVELKQLREKSLALRNRMLWLTLLLSLLLGVVTYLLASYFTRPIEAMIKAAIRVAHGQQDVEIPVKTHDEIGKLGEALRQMMAFIQLSKSEMQELNASLERKVSERTAQLSRLAGTLESQNQRLEQAVLDAEQAAVAKSQFLATMSHEIRTPLNGVLGLTELLLQSDLTPKQRDQLKTVQSSGETLLAILNDILDFSKIEAGQMELKPVEFNPNDVIEHVSKLFASRVNGEESVLELISSGIPLLPRLLVGDSDRLHQVMMNLLSNAVKFTEQGEIVISVEQLAETDDDVTLRFAVRDTGRGISEKDQLRLFEEFTQADGTDTRKHGGTGLGLSIVKRLVAMMGGEIQVESEIGKGSCFFFELTLEKGSAIDDGPHAYREDFSRWRVLVVDDNLTNRNMQRELLEAWGCRCDSFGSGNHALKALRAAVEDDPYDLIIIDQQMEQMDGMALARVIVESPELADLRVILTTTLDLTFDDALCEKYGLDGFLRKPLYVNSLFETTLAVMGARSRVVREARQQVKAVERVERILLAEDNAVNRQVALGMLANQGFHHVDVAHNGVEALELASQQRYDLILMDVQMPELDGIGATREIRELEQFDAELGHVPIIALTAHALAEDVERTRLAGMDGHLTKPLTGDALREMMAMWLPLSEADASAAGVEDGVEGDDSADEAADAAEQAAAEQAVDAAALRQLREDMGFGIGMILDAYLAELPKQVAAIQEAIEAGDGDLLRRNGHRLKGSSRSVAANALGEICFELEQLGAAGDIEAAAALLDRFKQAADAAVEALQAEWLQEIR